MVITFYNSLTKKKEPFKPLKEGKVTMYNCGPTVYSTPHIGNMRANVFADLIKRYLKFRGFQVKQIMNITDVGHLTSDGDEGEDKMQKAAKEEQLDVWQLAQKYTDLFMKDLEILNIDKADAYPKATDHIAEMIEIIKKLIEKDIAYESNGNIYFNVTKFPNYGNLSGNTLDKLQAQQRAVEDTNKQNPQDFVLWFSNSKYENHIMKWDSPWGEGYPGWHIECTAMSIKMLSDAFNGGSFHPDAFQTIDIHTGGEDNKFPHHECEIAQTESCMGKPFVQYWMHCRHLLIEGEKMSKSLGNIFTLSDYLNKGISKEALRYVLLATHYNMQMNVSEETLSVAQKNIDKFNEVIYNLQHITKIDSSIDSTQILKEATDRFTKAMDDDLNISGGFSALFETLRIINKQMQHLSITDAKKILDWLASINSVLGIMTFKHNNSINEEVEALITKRNEAREHKDWEKADQIRDQLKEKSIELVDTPEGTRWKKIE